MKPDAYTKTMLTIIAAALLVLVARSYQNPPPVLAQKQVNQTAQSVQRLPQHVIVDNLPAVSPQHVIIDELGVGMSLSGLPVSLKGSDDILGRSKALHVIVDDIDTRLALSGLPVSIEGFGPRVSLSGLPVSLKSGTSANGPAVRWRYDFQNGCILNNINQKAQQGWEFFLYFYSPVDQQRFGDVDKACTAFFRQPM